MLRNIQHLATLCLLSSLVAACGDDEVVDTIETSSSSTANFTEFETFAFVGPSDMDPRVSTNLPSQTAVNLDVVNQAVREELNALGLREVAPDQNPDLRAVSLTATADQEAISWSCVDGYWYGYWAWDFTPCDALAPVYTEYTEGAILTGLIDPNNQELVFSGLIVGIEDSSQDLTERIDEDMEAVFSDYPIDQTGN